MEITWRDISREGEGGECGYLVGIKKHKWEAQSSILLRTV